MNNKRWRTKRVPKNKKWSAESKFSQAYFFCNITYFSLGELFWHFCSNVNL